MQICPKKKINKNLNKQTSLYLLSPFVFLHFFLAFASLAQPYLWGNKHTNSRNNILGKTKLYWNSTYQNRIRSISKKICLIKKKYISWWPTVKPLYSKPLYNDNCATMMVFQFNIVFTSYLCKRNLHTTNSLHRWFR